MYEIKICDIYDVQKCLLQTWVDSEPIRMLLRLRLTSCVSIWDYLCILLVADTLNTCC